MVFSPDLGGKNGGVLSMRMQVILDSSFARPGSAPISDGKKGEFRDWTSVSLAVEFELISVKFTFLIVAVFRKISVEYTLRISSLSAIQFR